MILNLNPAKWFAKKPVAPAVVAQPSTALKGVETIMETTGVAAPKVNEFKNIMAHILKFATLGLVDIVKYGPEASALAAVLFPEVPQVAAACVVTTKVATLIQNTVLAVQAKYALATASNETNQQKLADVMSIVEAPAISLLTQAGVPANTARITSAINATVSILQNAPAPATPTP